MSLNFIQSYPVFILSYPRNFNFIHLSLPKINFVPFSSNCVGTPIVIPISSQLTPWVNWPLGWKVNWPPLCESTDPLPVGPRAKEEGKLAGGGEREEWGQLTIIGSTGGALGAGEQWGQLTNHLWGQMTQGVSWLVTVIPYSLWLWKHSGSVLSIWTDSTNTAFKSKPICQSYHKG